MFDWVVRCLTFDTIAQEILKAVFKQDAPDVFGPVLKWMPHGFVEWLALGDPSRNHAMQF